MPQSPPTLQTVFRRDETKAVRVTYTQADDDSVVLLKIEGVDGYVPESMEHLLHVRIPELVGAELAVVGSMGDKVGDTLDRTLVSEDYYNLWEEHSTASAKALMEAGVDPSHIGEEQARTDEHGGLLIFVDVKGHDRISLLIPEGQWQWRVRPH